MRTKSFILASVAAYGVLALSGTVQPAFSKSGATTLAPAGGWSVADIAAKGGADPYCALVRPFDKNVVLTLARNRKGESSLAVDFRNTTMDPASRYTVTLRPGKGEQRVYEVQPVSPAAFVVRMGQDVPFMEAMEKTDLLGIEMMDKAWSFKLSGFAKGQTQLDECVASLSKSDAPAMADAGRPVPLMTQDEQPTVAQEEQAEKQALAQADSSAAKTLRTQTVTEVADSGHLIKELESARREVEALKSEAADHQSSQTQAVAALEDKIKAAEAEKKALSDQLAAVKQDAESVKTQASKTASLEMEKTELTNQIAALKAEIETLKAVGTEQAAKAGQATAMEMKVKDLTGQMEALKSENTSLKAETDRLKPLVAAQAKDKDAVTALTAQLTQLRTEKEAIAKELASEKQKVVALAQAQAKIEPAAGDEAAEKGDAKAAAAESAELAKLKAEKAALEKTVADLKAGAATAGKDKTDAADAKVQELTAKLAEKEKELATTKADLANAEKIAVSNVQSADDVLRRQIVALRDQLEQEKLRSVTLSKQVASMEKQTASLSDSNWNLEEATKRYQQSEREVQRMGALIEQERLSCAKEKRELGSLMPDPGAARSAASLAPAAGVADAPVSAVPVAPVAREVAAADIAETAPVAAVAPQAPEFAFLPLTAVSGILEQSGVKLTKGVEKIAKASGPQSAAYRWEAGQVFGSMEQRALSGAFDSQVTAYLDKAKSRCKGDFAAMPATSVPAAGGMKVSAYEIACVAGDINVSAALLFFSRDNVFVSVAHETGAQSMDLAIDARDRFARTLTSGQIAAR